MIKTPMLKKLLFVIFCIAISDSFALADDCRVFSDTADLIDRQKYWETILLQKPQNELFDIITGIKPPPDIILKEVKQQSDCLISLIHIQLQKKGATVPPRQIISWHRDFIRQNSIWRRKYSFKVNFKFGIVTDSTRQICKDLVDPNESHWNPNKQSHQTCWKKIMSPEQRQLEILQTSSAPGTSRHHWGTDLDLFDSNLSPANWEPGKKFSNAYKLLTHHAIRYGFFQPYGRMDTRNDKGYLEERWHWSYFPIAEVFHKIIKNNQNMFEAYLINHWTSGHQFTYIKDNWKDYVLGITPIPPC